MSHSPPSTGFTSLESRGTARITRRSTMDSARQWYYSRGRLGTFALAFAVLSGVVTHSYHLFDYPLYETDEGIYLERAWAIIREFRLSPQTYVYDHAPGGWLLIASWVFLLPGHFEAFGNPVNSARVLMVLLHAGSTFFLFEIARKLSRDSLLAPTIACFFFNFSWLAVYYQRMALLDNIMVFWVLLSVYLLLREDVRLFTGLWSGLALGIAMITKENSVFFAPGIFYLLSRRANNDTGDSSRDFTLFFWLFAAATPVAAYSLYATLNGELFPPDMSFSLSHTHISLLYEMWLQIHRNQATLFNRHSSTPFLYTAWLPKDPFLLAAGTVAMVICILTGWGQRKKDPALLVAGALAFGIAFYLARGSVILDFYVIPLIPMYALCIALVADRAFKSLPDTTSRFLAPIVCAAVAAFLLLPPGGYLIKHGSTGQLQAADPYHVPLTFMQNEQITWIRQHVPPNSRIISDDDIWVALHDARPSYPYDESHWNAATDPQVRLIYGGGNWQDIDYIVMSNQMKQAMILNNTGGQEGWILNALEYHSTPVWSITRGSVSLAIYKVQHLLGRPNDGQQDQRPND
jgi:4-amino-4-deoxy-L-arabinose transferase-like glycosyltransferase